MCEEVINTTLKPVITEEMNQNLIKAPIAEEIKQAMFSIHPDKAPGPDGFSACFFSIKLGSGRNIYHLRG